MGKILLQPGHTPQNGAEELDIILFPRRLKDKVEADTILEWAFLSNAPVYCHKSDVKSIEQSIVGSNRYLNSVDGYKEIHFQNGSIEFYPAKRSRPKQFLKALLADFAEVMGWLQTQAYHVLVRPVGESAVLFLNTPEIDDVDWSLFERSKPDFIIGSADHSKREWKTLSKKLGGIEILWAPEVAFVQTNLEGFDINNIKFQKGHFQWKGPRSATAQAVAAATNLTDDASSF